MGRLRTLSGLAATLAAVSFVVGSVDAPVRTPRAAPAAHVEAPRAAAPSAPAVEKGTVEHRAFWSASLGRTMPYLVYLPPGYAEEPARRYPVVYLLHGMGGNDSQWVSLGVVGAADRLISTGAIAPMLIVMPEGERAYWVDHATDGQQWGRYTAIDLVGDVDASFRSIARKRARAIGGLSMGAHGALQLALNYPNEFGAVGAHSLVLRRFGSAPTYFGDVSSFAARDPMQIVKAKGRASCPFALWIDIGASDPWAPLARQFNAELASLGVAHQWHEWPGDHSGRYWSVHVEDYLRFYDAALRTRATGTPLS